MTTMYHANTRKNFCNTEEHKKWNRRSFLQSLGLVGGGAMALGHSALSVAKPSPLLAALSTVENDRILILIRLKGGNDGLNTIIPLQDYDTYANARPSIRINENNLFKLSDTFAMPSYANSLESMWGEGQMKVVHGVGYENSSLSHFTGSDIWASADPGENVKSGWMGRYFEERYPDFMMNPPKKPTAIQIGNNGSTVFNTQDINYSFAVSNPEKLYEIAKNGELYSLDTSSSCAHYRRVHHIKSEANITFTYAGVINEAFNKSRDFGNYPSNKLAHQLSLIARLIKGNLGTKVYMVELQGFDTHDDQKNRHQKLMMQLATTVSHFYKDLAQAGWEDKVLAMTISEFGRRVAENGSGGTDHGAASPSLFFGGGLNGNGFAGVHPDLKDTDQTGNLKPTIDFRQLYATVLKEWMCVNPEILDKVMLSQSYKTLPLGFICSGDTAQAKFNNQESHLKHTVTYEGGNTYLHVTSQKTMHVDIRLFDLIGREVGMLKNGILFSDRLKIDIKNTIKNSISPGQYVYRISTGTHALSKTLLIL